MTDQDALLAACLAAPDDDAPWLAYLDWLTERGRDGTAVRAVLAAGRGPARRLWAAQLFLRAPPRFLPTALPVAAFADDGQ